jgi:hypothetical protein
MITIKINERTKTGKAFMAMVEAFFKNVEGIEIVDNNAKKEVVNDNESLYNPEFVKMILERDADIKSGKSKCITVDPDDIWGSLGLK